MTKKTTPVTNAKTPVREGLAYLIEDVFDRADVVFAARAISDELTKTAQNIEKMVADKVMPLVTSMSEKLGPDAAKRIGDRMTQIVRNASGAVQNSNGELMVEIDRLEKGVQGGDISDMGMDTSADMGGMGGDMGMGAPGADMGGDMGAPNTAPPAGAPAPGGLSDVPPDATGNAEDDALMGGPAAGRPLKKESARVRGKAIKEADVQDDGWIPGHMRGGKKFIPGNPGGPSDKSNREPQQDQPKQDKPLKEAPFDANPTASTPVPAIDSHPYKSADHDTNLQNLGMFHGGASKLANNINNMIASEKLSGEERRALANVLSHLAAFATQPGHFAGVDPEAKLRMSLQSAGIWDVDQNQAVKKIVVQLGKLVHLLSMHHEGLLHENINRLRRAKNPDAIVVEAFRIKLSESRDAQLAAINTARMFAIDIEDVVSAVKEAAVRRPFLREFDAKINPKKRGMFKGQNVSDIKKDLTKQKATSKAAQDRGEHVPDSVKTKEKEDMFAIRAKKGWKGGVNEDEVAQSAPLFPIEQSQPVQAGQSPQQPTSNQMQPVQMVPPNQSQSSNKPLTPADKRMAQSQGVDAGTNAGQRQMQPQQPQAQQPMQGQQQPQVQPQQPQQAPVARMAPTQQTPPKPAQQPPQPKQAQPAQPQQRMAQKPKQAFR